MFVSLGSITEFTDSSLFDIKHKGFSPVNQLFTPIANQVQLVTVDLSSNLTSIKRYNYGLFHAIVQLGGFMFVFGIVAMMLMSCALHDERGYVHAENLYRQRTLDGRSEDLRRGRCANLRGFMIDRYMMRSCYNFLIRTT